MVSLPQKQFIAILLAVCVLSAGIGSGLALLAQTGPSGATGKRGSAGPEGPEGPSGSAEVEGLEAEVEELRGEIEDSGETQNRLEELEEELSGLSSTTSELCLELELFC